MIVKGGRKTRPVYHYDTAENGYKYLGQFSGVREVFKMYFDGKVGRLVHIGWKYRKLPDGTYVSFERIGRDGLIKAIREQTDPTIVKRNGDREIELVNGKGEVVGVLANVRILESILSDEQSGIKSSLYDNRKPHFGSLSARYIK